MYRETERKADLFVNNDQCIIDAFRGVVACLIQSFRIIALQFIFYQVEYISAFGSLLLTPLQDVWTVLGRIHMALVCLVHNFL